MTEQARMQEAPINFPAPANRPTPKPHYPSFLVRYEWAMSHKLPATERLVLIHIAYRAGTTRGCTASQEINRGRPANQPAQRHSSHDGKLLDRQGLIKHGGTTHAMTTIWHLALDVQETTAASERGCDTESHLDAGCDRESQPHVTQSHMGGDAESPPWG